MVGPFYLDDDEAREDWDLEREAFCRPGVQEDLPFGVPLPERFWIDTATGLPIVRDRVHNDQMAAQFVTLGGAEAYKRLREDGVGHNLAIQANPETRWTDVAPQEEAS